MDQLLQLKVKVRLGNNISPDQLEDSTTLWNMRNSRKNKWWGCLSW